MRLNKTNKAVKLFLIFIAIAIFITFYSLQPPKRPNVILILLDDLRADHLGCYGYIRDTSPNIDGFAKEGQLFSNAFSQAAYTLASLPSIFTSKTPFSHGLVTLESGDKLKENENTLAEILKDNGYVTAAFSELEYAFVKQGFDDLIKVGDSEHMNRSVFNWLESNKKSKKGKPFFLFMHIMTTHEPFDPPEPFNKMFSPSYQGYLKNEILSIPFFNLMNEKVRQGELALNKEDLAYIISQYDGDIRYCDHHVGELFRRIKKLGLDSDTIMIITADHGSDLMDHGSICHDDVYDAGIHVPLIFRYPRLIKKNKRIDTPVRSIDILPTILDILQLPLKQGMEGSSLLPLLLGRADEKERLIFSVGGFLDKENFKLSLRTKDWKLIVTLNNNKHELFNLKNDPKELKNLVTNVRRGLRIFQVTSENEHFEVLKMKMEEYLSLHKLNSSPSSKTLDENVKRSLRALGYLQ